MNARKFAITFDDILHSAKNCKVEYISGTSFPDINPPEIRNHLVRLHVTDCVVRFLPIVKKTCENHINTYILFVDDLPILGGLPAETRNTLISYTSLAKNISQIPLLMPADVAESTIEKLRFGIATKNISESATQLSTSDITVTVGDKKYNNIVPPNLRLFIMPYGTPIIVDDIRIMSRAQIHEIKEMSTNMKNYLGPFRQAKVGWGFYRVLKENKHLSALDSADRLNHVLSVCACAPRQPMDMLLESLGLIREYILKCRIDGEHLITPNIDHRPLEAFLRESVCLYLHKHNTIVRFVGDVQIVNDEKQFTYEILRNKLGSPFTLKPIKDALVSVVDRLTAQIEKIPPLPDVPVFDGRLQKTRPDIYAADKKSI